MPVLYSKWFMIVRRWNLETKGCSSVMAMPCGEKFISLFMHSQKRPDGHGHNYKTDSLVVFIRGLFLIGTKGKIYPSVRNHQGAIGPRYDEIRAKLLLNEFFRL